ncbi:MAG: hypothetical protein HY060_11260, partial [Proteobacteria bacterium]|nr:hypothetical protein [Pseudomonadota bacterium]
WRAWAELNPDTARRFGIAHGATIRVSSRVASIDVVATLVDRTPPAAPVRRLERALIAVAAQSNPKAQETLSDVLTASLSQRLTDLRLMLEAAPVTLDSLPDGLRRAWVAADGQARIEVFPKGDTRRNDVIARFVAVAGLLLITLRRLRVVALVLTPLLLAGLLSLITCVVIGLPLNFANIIALPLLLGIGVAFDIYFVMNWRAGLAGPLQSSTARAVLFSALTTTTAFGSLALSRHPGTAGMGALLSMGLFYTVLCTLVVLPALLGQVKPRA